MKKADEPRKEILQGLTTRGSKFFYGMILICGALIFGIAPDGRSEMASGDAGGKVEKLLKSVLDQEQPGLALYPKEWGRELVSKTIDLGELNHEEYIEGTAYGAVSSKVVDCSYLKVKEALSSHEGLFRYATKIKTLRDLVEVGGGQTDLNLKTAIKVPLHADFHTQIAIKFYEDKRGRGIVVWRQFGTEGDLAYNQGALVAEADGPRTKIFVIGVHILKPEKKIGWFGRSAAKGFAKTHYGNFISGLELDLGIAAVVTQR